MRKTTTQKKKANTERQKQHVVQATPTPVTSSKADLMRERRINGDEAWEIHRTKQRIIHDVAAAINDRDLFGIMVATIEKEIKAGKVPAKDISVIAANLKKVLGIPDAVDITSSGEKISGINVVLVSGKEVVDGKTN